ncbi:helix-turn-helix transcriptional regulator [Salipiger pacificus]|nr:helix-turn-helix transcriptional regulator [Alloyangia pacifica]
MATLAQFLKQSQMTQRAFADAVGVSQPTVNRWLNGAMPSWARAATIERVTGGKVPVASWVSVPSQEAS